MKQLFILLILAGLVYGGYLYYRQSKTVAISQITPVAQGQLVIAQASDNLGSLAMVLGAHAQSLYESGVGALSSATGGQSDPIVNRVVTNLQSQVKDLPAETVNKVKYEFCKGVVTEYEASQSAKAN